MRTETTVRKHGVILCKPSTEAVWLRDHGYMAHYHLLYGVESGIPMCCVVEFVRDWHVHWMNLPRQDCQCRYRHCEECRGKCEREGGGKGE